MSKSLNLTIIGKLIAKDWYFFRWLVMGYGAGGLVGLTLMFFANSSVSMFGSILTVVMIISLGCHLVMGTIVAERKEGTLAFLMSLPASAADYTLAKIVANVTIFLVPWIVVSILLLHLVNINPAAPNGMIPFFVLMSIELFITYLVLLATALIVESEAWTIVAMVVCNSAFSLVAMGLMQLDGIAAYKESAVAVWTTESLTVLGFELAIIVGVIATTFYLQNRKTDFL